MMKETKFVSIPVYGSLAYDFETAVPLPEREWERPRRDERKVVIPAPPDVKEREQVRPKPVRRPKQSVSPFSIIGFSCAAVLLIFMLMAKIQLTVITDEAAVLETQLEELQFSQARLMIEHETVFNRTEIEEYAVNTLGMQRPREEQIIYLNSSAPDKAVVLGSTQESTNFFERLSIMFGAFAEYF